MAYLPTIGYMNTPGPPRTSGGTMACNGAVILTEDRIIMFGSKADASASASDVIAGTTLCTSICCCFPCCYGKQSPTSRNSVFPSLSLASWVPLASSAVTNYRILVDTVEGPGTIDTPALLRYSKHIL